MARTAFYVARLTLERETCGTNKIAFRCTLHHQGSLRLYNWLVHARVRAGKRLLFQNMYFKEISFVTSILAHFLIFVKGTMNLSFL